MRPNFVSGCQGLTKASTPRGIGWHSGRVNPGHGGADRSKPDMPRRGNYGPSKPGSDGVHLAVQREKRRAYRRKQRHGEAQPGFRNGIQGQIDSTPTFVPSVGDFTADIAALGGKQTVSRAPAARPAWPNPALGAERGDQLFGGSGGDGLGQAETKEEALIEKNRARRACLSQAFFTCYDQKERSKS